MKRAMWYILFRYSITVKTTFPSLCFVFVYTIHIHTAGVAKNASSPKVCFVYLCIYVSYSSLCIFSSSGLHAGRGVCLCVHHLSQQGRSFNWVTESQFFMLTIQDPSHGFVLQMANILTTSHFQTRLDPVSCFVLVLEFFVIMVQVILLFCPSFRVVIMDQVEMGAIWPVITKYESMTMQHFNNKQ